MSKREKLLEQVVHRLVYQLYAVIYHSKELLLHLPCFSTPSQTS
ncbi:MAG: hypothetical protein ACE5R6_11175 [Candidatus Heimdallarchaeota archaeon]